MLSKHSTFPITTTTVAGTVFGIDKHMPKDGDGVFDDIAVSSRPWAFSDQPACLEKLRAGALRIHACPTQSLRHTGRTRGSDQESMLLIEGESR